MPTPKQTVPAPAISPVKVEVLAEHYQKTFEVAYDYWKERNKLFVFLVLTAGIGLMLLLRVPTADQLLVDAIAKFLDITDETRKAELYSTFPFIDVHQSWLSLSPAWLSSLINSYHQHFNRVS